MIINWLVNDSVDARTEKGGGEKGSEDARRSSKVNRVYGTKVEGEQGGSEKGGFFFRGPFYS